MSEMNVEPVIYFLISTAFAVLFALVALLMLRATRESQKPERIAVRIKPARRIFSPQTDDIVPAATGFGSRYSTRGPPVLPPPPLVDDPVSDHS